MSPEIYDGLFPRGARGGGEVHITPPRPLRVVPLEPISPSNTSPAAANAVAGTYNSGWPHGHNGPATIAEIMAGKRLPSQPDFGGGISER